MMNYTTMTTEELQKELDRLENQKFMLAMADHWDSSDYDFDRKLSEQIRKIENELKKR